MSNVKKTDIRDKILGLSLNERTILVVTAGLLENIFTFSVFCYLKIWPMAVITVSGIVAFIFCAKNVAEGRYTAIYITVLVYSLVAVLVAAFYAEWAYGFQNYLFVPVQLCFAIVYRESNFKSVLKYAILTFVLVVITYCLSIFICFSVKPSTGASIYFISFVNVVNALFIFLINSIVLIRLFVELFNEHNALNTANSRLAKYADRDPLTNLYNRRFAENILNKMNSVSPPLTLILCDIDHFKGVNDTLGHAAGDSVLVHVARVILGNIHYKDFAIRWGGEEFLLIINNADSKVALKTIERIMSQLRGNQFFYEDKPVTVTLTAGVAQYTPGTDDLEEAIKLADKRLYIGKNSGRNKYVIED